MRIDMVGGPLNGQVQEVSEPPPERLSFPVCPAGLKARYTGIHEQMPLVWDEFAGCYRVEPPNFGVAAYTLKSDGSGLRYVYED